jgi:putative endonuclease
MRYNAEMREYYVYILASKRNGTLYVGMTEDIAKRVIRHKGRQANEFTAKYDVLKLVYYERHKSLEEAVKREKQVKKWNRRWKIRIIEQLNPKWEDLFSETINANNPGSPAENQGSLPRGHPPTTCECGQAGGKTAGGG